MHFPEIHSLLRVISLSCFPQVFKRCKATGSMLDTVDACSMLCRLEMEGKIQSNKVNSQDIVGIGTTVCIRENVLGIL